MVELSESTPTRDSGTNRENCVESPSLPGIFPPEKQGSDVKSTPKKPRRLKAMKSTDKSFKGRCLPRHAQAIIYNVNEYFELERKNGGPLLTVQQVQ